MEVQNPAPWINRTQGHIVVSINYRVNIFGYPNAAGAPVANLAILDQRLALEWVYANIAAFGGDPERIMIWGQSAGAQSVDQHNYAYWDNPISHTSFSQSGTALKSLPSVDYGHTNFTFVARAMGCDFPADPVAELECMQQVPMRMIEDFLGKYSSTPRIKFGPIVDEILLFSDYAARARSGKISPNPAIFSDAANNDASLTAWPTADVAKGPNQTTVNAGTLAGWVCPTANTSQIRRAANLTTYHYQYAGGWPNQTPYQWLTGCHSSDLPMNFGTTYLSTTNASDFQPTQLQTVTSHTMQDLILSFMKNPYGGPPAMGWQPYTYGTNVLRFGADGVAVQNVTGYEIDGPCFGNGTYNPFP